MAKADILSILYSKEKSPLEFKFDSLWIPSMYNFLTPQDIQELHYLASSARFSSKIDFKYKEIDRIMTNRGFKKFHCGTNRIVYSYLEDQSFLVKIALDKVGLSDNPAEYRNQFLLKPFVTKVFEVSPCGTVATVERVEPITSREEFMSIGEDIFDLMNKCIIGRYVLEDVGTKYFMNWGLRKGFGAVLLDYTYVYELDGNKLFCNKVIPETGEVCNGVIDYDSGFNNLICTKCGKRYLAKELEQSVKDKLIILKDEGEIDMKIRLKRGRETVATFFSNDESETIVRKKKNSRTDINERQIRVSLSSNSNTIADYANISGIVMDYFDEEDTSMPKIKSSISGLNREPKIENVQQEEQYYKVENEKVEEPEVEVNIKEDEDIVEEEKEVIEPVQEEEKVKEETKKTPIYTRDLEVDVKSKFLTDEEKDMIAKFGLSDEDFEEPKEEKENKEDVMSKYYDEYDDETENFEKIKNKKKSIIENY